MIFSTRSGEQAGALFGDPGAIGVAPPFGLFEWFIKPHLNSSSFPERDGAWADRIAAAAEFPIYFLDDESALRVEGDVGEEVVQAIGEGTWRLVPGRDG